jgi:hypothetical protein
MMEFQIVGGPGADTLLLVSVTLTEAEREAVLSTMFIETIVDGEGIFTAPPHRTTNDEAALDPGP